MKKLIILLSFIVSIYVCSYADAPRADYLLTDMYPSVQAVGSAAGAATGVFDSIGINPAAGAYVENLSCAVMQNIQPMGMTNQKLSIAKAFEFGVLGFEYSYFNLGSIQEIKADVNGAPVFTGNDMGLSAGYASFIYAKKMKNISLGITARIIGEDIGKQATLADVDAGFMYDKFIVKDMKLGISMTNIGKTSDSMMMPFSFRAALSDRFMENSRELFTLDGGLLYIKSGDYVEFQAGGSYSPVRLINLRAGLSLNGNGDVNFTLGAGINFDDFSLNYAYIPGNVLGDTHKISLEASLPQAAEIKEGNGKPGDSAADQIKKGDMYYQAKQFSQALKFYEKVNVLYWKEFEALSDSDKSSFYQKLGICYYSLRDNARASQYFEKALYYSPDNEAIKYWIKSIK
jgi:hypothetical protein